MERGKSREIESGAKGRTKKVKVTRKDEKQERSSWDSNEGALRSNLVVNSLVPRSDTL